ncbi:MAG: glucuronate isomerase [Bacillus subtilis]|nr:glucuronate isomerase [Bacillus subtilis]
MARPKKKSRKRTSKPQQKQPLLSSEIMRYKGHILVYLRSALSSKWVGSSNTTSARSATSLSGMYDQLGPDTGYDAINDGLIAHPLSALNRSTRQNEATCQRRSFTRSIPATSKSRSR